MDVKKNVLHICEGEEDCHALIQMGVENVVSLPDGATSYTPAMDVVNTMFDSLVLLFDNDRQGQEGAQAFAWKAGINKCSNVFLPYKDARECLIQGMNIGDLSRYIQESSLFEIKEIVKASDVNYEKPVTIETDNKGFNELLGGIRSGEITIMTGHTGHGKTTAALNISIWTARNDNPVFILSFENSFYSIINKLIQINSGEIIFKQDDFTKIYTLCVTDEWKENEIKKIDSLPLWFLNSKSRNGYFDLKAIEELCSYAVKFYGVKLIIIDNLHYILKIKDPRNQTHEIDESIRRISNLAKNINSHILLVAHPYKSENPQTGKVSKLGLYCIKGSSTIVQECSNFIVIERGVDKDDKKSQWRLIKCREGRLGEKSFNVADNLNRME